MHFCVNDGSISPLNSLFHVIAMENFIFSTSLMHFSESFYFHNVECPSLCKFDVNCVLNITMR